MVARRWLQIEIIRTLANMLGFFFVVHAMIIITICTKKSVNVCANNVHYEVGKNIREVIQKNGETMPKDSLHKKIVWNNKKIRRHLRKSIANKFDIIFQQ